MNRRRLLPIILSKKNSGLYNIAGGLANWKSLRSTGWPAVWIYGDSIGTGANATTPATEGWAQRLATDITSLYGNGGHYYQRTADAASVVASANWIAGNGCGRGGWTHHSADTDTLVLTATNCKYLDVYYLKSSISAQFTIQLDAEAPIAAQYGNPQAVEKLTLTAASEGTHTVTVTPGNANWLWLFGIMARNAAGGAIVYNWSVSGAVLPAASSSVFGSLQQRTLQPALVIVALGINGYGADPQTAPATYSANYAQTIADCKYAGNSMLLIAENPDNRAKTIPQTTYDALILAQAQANNLAFVNMDWLMGNSWATAKARGYFTGTEATHPNTVGHTFYYNSIVPYITG